MTGDITFSFENFEEGVNKYIEYAIDSKIKMGMTNFDNVKDKRVEKCIWEGDKRVAKKYGLNDDEYGKIFGGKIIVQGLPKELWDIDCRTLMIRSMPMNSRQQILAIIKFSLLMDYYENRN